MHPSNSAALLVIDVQNDFCPGGALAVERGDEVVTPINTMMGRFGNVVMTQDWHPQDHVSFAANHESMQPFQAIELDYGSQTLWPAHCVIGSEGAAFHPQLDTSRAQLVVRKGFRSAIDSYSAFFENDRTTPTGLHGYLQDRSIDELVLCGLATDYCVAWSALDAARLGYRVTVTLSACRAIDLEGSLAAQIDAMKAAQIQIVE